MAALSQSNLFLCTTTFFKDPNDPDASSRDITKGRAWAPFDPQIQLYNCLDYGYDVVNNVLPPSHAAEMIVMIWPRQYGKTEGVASAIGGLLVRYPNAKIGVMSNNQDNAQKLVDRIAFFIRQSIFADMIDIKKVDRLKLTNNAEVFSFGQTENIRGNSLWWLFVDEAAQFDDDLLDGAALPTVRAAGAFRRFGTPSIILLSTPRGAGGRFIDYYHRGLEGREIGCKKCADKRPLDHPHFIGVNFGPRDMPALDNCLKCGANNYEYVSNHIITITLDPYNHPLRTKEEIDRELDLRGNTSLARQELLGEIISGDTGVFKDTWLQEATGPDIRNFRNPVKGVRYVVSADFGKNNDATVICVGHTNNDGECVMDYIQHLRAQGGMDYAEVRYHLMNLVEIYNPYQLVLDSTGIGDPVTEALDWDLRALTRGGLRGSYTKNGTVVNFEIDTTKRISTRIYCNKTNRLGYVFDYNSKLDLVDNLVNLFQRKLIKIPSQYVHADVKILWKELLNFGFKYSNNGRIIYGIQRDHDDTVIALALLAWGLRERSYFVSKPAFGGRSDFVL